MLDGPEPPVDLVHTTEFLRRLPATELVEARRLLVEHFGGVDLDARRGRIALIGCAAPASPRWEPCWPIVWRRRSSNWIADRAGERRQPQRHLRSLRAERISPAGAPCLDQVIERYPRFVLATGGSLVSEPATFERLLTMCFTVWLRATPEEHMQRVIAQGDMRPMADNRESMSDLRRILEVREPLYRKADATIDTSGDSVEKT